MALSLHSALVPSMLQILGSLDKMLEKAQAWCDDHEHAHSELIEARLIDDMLPFAYQVKSCWAHSALAIHGVREGMFSPETSPPPNSFGGLQDKVREAAATLGAVTEDELEALTTKPVQFRIGDKFSMDFTGQDFLLSFSQPNFYFHAATAYDILRMKGVPVGKRDYLGALRTTV